MMENGGLKKPISSRGLTTLEAGGRTCSLIGCERDARVKVQFSLTSSALLSAAARVVLLKQVRSHPPLLTAPQWLPSCLA